MAAVKQHLPLQTGLQQTCIEGVVLQELQIIATAGGPVLHMLKAGSPLVPDFSCGFGEIYFSEVVPGAVKAWKCHRRQSQLFAVPHGLLQIVLYDGRSASARSCSADLTITPCCVSPPVSGTALPPRDKSRHSFATVPTCRTTRQKGRGYQWTAL